MRKTFVRNFGIITVCSLVGMFTAGRTLMYIAGRCAGDVPFHVDVIVFSTLLLGFATAAGFVSYFGEHSGA